MEWLLIPGILAALTLVYFLCWLNQPRYNGHGEFWSMMAVVSGFILVIMLVVSPVVYYTSQNDAIKAQAYYDTVIEPNIIEVGNGTVVVTGIGPAMWQAGSVVDYNGYLRSNRHWNTVPILGRFVYGAPAELPYVEVR